LVVARPHPAELVNRSRSTPGADEDEERENYNSRCKNADAALAKKAKIMKSRNF
jgi:hypothetical protein